MHLAGNANNITSLSNSGGKPLLKFLGSDKINLQKILEPFLKTEPNKC
jgi:hypothetical protein